MNFNTFYDVNDNVVKIKAIKSLPNELSREHKNERTKDYNNINKFNYTFGFNLNNMTVCNVYKFCNFINQFQG